MKKKQDESKKLKIQKLDDKELKSVSGGVIERISIDDAVKSGLVNKTQADMIRNHEKISGDKDGFISLQHGDDTEVKAGGGDEYIEDRGGWVIDNKTGNLFKNWL